VGPTLWKTSDLAIQQSEGDEIDDLHQPEIVSRAR
jgi:hypothetical protein